MNSKMTEEWLILLFLQTTTKEKLLKEIFKLVKDIKKAIDIIDIVQEIESSDDNATR